jgi:large subunit ribosomal protein L17
MPGTRKLGRTTDHRMSMLKGMTTYLIENGKIETTYYRAKEVSALADKMITLAKSNNLTSKRRAMAFLKKEEVVYTLFNKVAPFYAEKTSGYTRVLKTGPRRGDGAEMAIITLIDADKLYKKEDKKADKKAAKKSAEPKAEQPKAAEPKAE